MHRLLLILALLLPALPANASNGRLMMVEGQNASRAGDYDRAIDLYTQALASGDLQPALQMIVYNSRGLVYYRKRQFPLAVNDYTEALQIDPASATVLRNRCFAYIEMKNWTAAQQDCTASASAQPNEPQGSDTAGYVYLRQGLYPTAIEHFDRSISLDPTYGPAYLHRGIAYYRMGNQPMGRQDLFKARELMPGNPEVLTQLQLLGLEP